MHLLPEEEEDMWHAYNLIQEGDYLRCTTFRKVTSESATGSTSSQKVRTMLTVEVETINFDTQGGTLHVKGKNREENQHVKLGAYHTLDLELQRKFSLTKTKWDSIHLDRVNMAADPRQHADVVAVVMQEGNQTQHDKGVAKFYDQVAQALTRHSNFDVIKCILIASPGFVKDQFYEYLFEKAGKGFSGFKHSLKEVLQDPAVATKLADTKAAAEVKSLEQFYEMLQTEPARAYYGLGHVEKANKALAIETLMVSDDLFRSKDLKQRQRYVKLVESVKEQGCAVRIFSTLHVSGEQLAQLSGVAAILRFPMPEIEDEEEEEGQEPNGLLDEAAGGVPA